MSRKFATVVLIPVEFPKGDEEDQSVYQHRYLAVKRKDGGWGLPGGKVEDGECLFEAAIRELTEETGLAVAHCETEPFFASKDGDYHVVAFIGSVSSDWKLLSEPETGSELAAMSPAQLCDETLTPFATYNTDLFRVANSLLECARYEAEVFGQ